MSHALLAEEVAALVATAILLSACAGADSTEPAAAVVEVSSVSAPTPMAVSSFPGQRRAELAPLAWQSDLDVARSASRQSGRQLLVYVRADWSVACKVMERELWPAFEARQAAARFIPVMVDVTDVDDPVANELTIQLQAESVPAVVVVGVDGAVLTKHLGMMTVEQLRALLADR